MSDAQRPSKKETAASQPNYSDAAFSHTPLPGDSMMIHEVIVVEGKDDIAAVKAAVQAECIMTHGNGLNPTIAADIQEAAARCGIIILTDPDYAGKRIRRLVTDLVPDAKQAYLPRNEALRGDDIGVENAAPEAIRRALAKARPTLRERCETFSKQDLLAHGLDAAEGAKDRRISLTSLLGLSYGNAKQLLSRLNAFGIAREEFETAMQQVHAERGEEEV